MRNEEPSGLDLTVFFITSGLLVGTGLILFVYGASTLLFGGGRDTSLAFNISATGWSLIFLFTGIFLVMAGGSMISGKTWGRTVGIAAAVVVILGAFLSFEAYPVWAAVLIVFNIVIIWSLWRHHTESPFA